MIILKNPTINDLYLFHFGEEVIKVNFLLRQIASIRKDSPFFKMILLNDLVEPESTEYLDINIVKKAKLLINHLQLDTNKKVNVFTNVDDSSCFLLRNEGKFIQVDTKLRSLNDHSDSLFLHNTYDFGAPEKEIQQGIDAYIEIVCILYERIFSIGVRERVIY